LFRVWIDGVSKLVRLGPGDYWLTIQNDTLYVLNRDDMILFPLGPAPSAGNEDARVKLTVDEDGILYVDGAPVIDEVEIFDRVKIEAIYDVDEDLYESVSDEHIKFMEALARDENDIVRLGDEIEKDVLNAMNTLFADVGIKLPTSRRFYEFMLDVYSESTEADPDSIVINVDHLSEVIADTLRGVRDAKTGELLIENVSETAKLLAEILAADDGFRAIVAAGVKALEDAEDEVEEILTYTYAVKAKIYALTHALDDLPQFNSTKLEALRRSIVNSVMRHESARSREAHTA